ncbi:hypothetical protein QTP88_004972 [Uroleucon formosanum]
MSQRFRPTGVKASFRRSARLSLWLLPMDTRIVRVAAIWMANERRRSHITAAGTRAAFVAFARQPCADANHVSPFRQRVLIRRHHDDIKSRRWQRTPSEKVFLSTCVIKAQCRCGFSQWQTFHIIHYNGQLLTKYKSINIAFNCLCYLSEILQSCSIVSHYWTFKS